MKPGPMLVKPSLFLLYGFPGSGKSFFARQFSEQLHIAHVSSDRIRHMLFEQPNYTKNEERIVLSVMEMMTEEFLRSGMSVIFDHNATRLSERRRLRDTARHFKAAPFLLWFQIDAETAWARVASRDRRRTDDKFAQSMNQDQFDAELSKMQHPQNEDYIVISGKHVFSMQRNAVFQKLRSLGLLHESQSDMPKPELVNLVSRAAIQAGRVDMARRNINIR